MTDRLWPSGESLTEAYERLSKENAALRAELAQLREALEEANEFLVACVGMGVIPENAPTFDPHGYLSGNWEGKRALVGTFQVVQRALSSPHATASLSRLKALEKVARLERTRRKMEYTLIGEKWAEDAHQETYQNVLAEIDELLTMLFPGGG